MGVEPPELQQKGSVPCRHGSSSAEALVSHPGRQHCAGHVQSVSVPKLRKHMEGSSGRVHHFRAHLELRFGLGKSLCAVSCVGPQNSDGRAQSMVCVHQPWVVLTDLGD